MATALARLNSGLDSVNRQIRLQVEGNYAGLIGQIEHVDSLEGLSRARRPPACDGSSRNVLTPLPSAP